MRVTDRNNAANVAEQAEAFIANCGQDERTDKTWREPDSARRSYSLEITAYRQKIQSNSGLHIVFHVCWLFGSQSEHLKNKKKQEEVFV